MCSLLYEVCCRFHIFQRHILGSGNIDQHAACTVDRRLHKGAGHCHAGRILSLALAAGMADTHMGKAGILHDAGDISKVEVDKAGIFDQVRYAGYCLLQNIVRNFKCIGECDFLIGRAFEPVIRDNEKGVNLGEEFLNSLICLVHPALAFELERFRHDADCQAAHLMGNLGNRRACTGSGAATHTGRNKHHICIFKRSRNAVSALFRSTLTDFRIGACTLAARNFFTNLNFLIRIGYRKCLLICIDGNKLDTLCSGLHHPIDNVISSAANSHHFYGDNIFRACIFKIHNQKPPAL